VLFKFSSVFIWPHPNLLQGESKRSSIRLNDVSRNSWANSVLDLKSSKPDELLPHLLDKLPIDDVDCVNERNRAVSRHRQLFTIYQPHDQVCWSVVLFPINHI